MEGPTIEKAWHCLIEERARGTKSSHPAADQKTLRSAVSESTAKDAPPDQNSNPVRCVTEQGASAIHPTYIYRNRSIFGEVTYKTRS